MHTFTKQGVKDLIFRQYFLPMATNQFRQYHHELADTAWLFVLQGLNLLVPLFVWPYLMRTVGAEQFGVFGFAHALADYACLIVDFGFNLSATKRVVLARENKAELNRIFSATMCAKIILLFIAFCLYASVLFIPRYQAYRTMALFMFLSVVASTFSMVWLFQGMGKIRLVSIIQAVSKIIFLPNVFWLIKSPDDLWIAVTIHCSMHICSMVAVLIVLHNRHWVRPVRVTKDDILGEMKLSAPIFLSQAATSIYTALFVVILAYFVSKQEVGWYTSSEKIMRVMVSVVLLPISGAFYPKISALSISNKSEAQRFIRWIILFLGVFFSIAGLALCLAADFIIDWLGPDYNGMQPLLYMVAFLPIPITIGAVCGQFGLLALGDEHSKKTYTRVYYVAALWALISVFVLSKLFGVVGTMASLASTEILVCVSMAYYYIKYVKKTVFNN